MSEHVRADRAALIISTLGFLFGLAWLSGMLIVFSGTEVVEGETVYVLGDHRDSSNDSRNPLIGAVPNSRIKGKTLFIYMSWKNTRASLWERIRWPRVGTSVD